MTEEYEYEVALSFAGEDRALVEKIATGLRLRRVRVFYDQFEKSKLWGRDLYQYLYNVYSSKSRYCIIFVSKAYISKPWTQHEIKAAQSKQLVSTAEYILPIRLDDSELPGLATTIGYIDSGSSTAEEIIELVMEKLGRKTPKLFRGMDLGHDINPLSSALTKMDALVFNEICAEILSNFKFRVAKKESLESSVLSSNFSIGSGLIYTGFFQDAFPYSQQISREIGVSLDKNASRIFGEEMFTNENTAIQEVGGLAKVVIHSTVKKEPSKDDVLAFGSQTRLDTIKNVVFIVNENLWHSDFYFGIVDHNLRQVGLNAVVLFCDDLALPILTTDIYRKYETHIKWLYKNHL